VPDWPVVPLYAFLVVVAFCRAGASYAVGRGARGAAGRRWALDATWLARGEEVVGRFGAPAITLCFLTVGIQTAVNLAAGTLRMPLRRYLPALFLGALLWAAVYLAIGIAVVETFWGSGRPWALLAVVAALVAIAAVIRHLLRRRLTPPETGSSHRPADR
jgi:membrane protein DedA with SNARE-associated domain